ncbi:hypothetical protein R6Q59_005321 [Mikania micrantha]
MNVSSPFYRPLPHPYTWCPYVNQGVISNNNLLFNNFEEIEQRVFGSAYQIRSYPLLESDNEAQIHDRFVRETLRYNGGYHQSNRYVQVDPIDEVLMFDSFDQETEHYNGGLIEKVISENLKLSIHSDDDEDDEICVICQMEFERSERLGVLECNHRFHPTCIKEWLIRKNLCPVCKAQALMV